MRGEPSKQSTVLFLKSPEALVPKEHPIRAVKALADAALREMSGKFDEMYSGTGRASIPPEWLLKGSLLMALYSVRSERMFCEQLGYNMLFRWFLDMEMTEAPFDHSTFSKNRERLMQHGAAQEFFRQVVGQARDARLVSSEHFTVDGTLIEAWASLKSFQAKDDSRKKRNAAKRARRNRREAVRKVAAARIPRSASAERNAPTKRTSRKRIRSRDSLARATERKPS